MDKRTYARFKRCMDWYSADPDFRARMEADPQGAMLSLGYEKQEGKAALEAIRWILFRNGGAAAAENPYVRAAVAYEAKIREKLSRVHSPASYASANWPAYLASARERCRTENRLIRSNQNIYYYPLALELSSGCSVQCSFCGLSAPRLTANFRYTKENAALFSGVVRACLEEIGPAAGFCPLYFATEPFDNPDYERFMADFADIAGMLPQTTTAVAERDPERLRRYLDFIRAHEDGPNAALRISIRSLDHFRKIVSLYSEDETADAEFIANNPESVHRCSASGRALENAQGSRKTERYSICCISGVKVNLPGRTVAFIEPELPDEETPVGYRVLDSRTFADAEDFARILSAYAKRFVHGVLPMTLPLRFNGNTEVLEDPAAWLFMGDGCGYRIGKNYFTSLVVSGIAQGKSLEACLAPFHLAQDDFRRLHGAFNELYIRGYIRICKN